MASVSAIVALSGPGGTQGSSVIAGQTVTATVTVFSSTAALTVLSIDMWAVPQTTAPSPILNPAGLSSGRGGNYAVSQPWFGPGSTNSVAANSSANFAGGFVFLAPQSGYGLAEPTLSAYSVGGLVYLADGTSVIITPACVTVGPPVAGTAAGGPGTAAGPLPSVGKMDFSIVAGTNTYNLGVLSWL